VYCFSENPEKSFDLFVYDSGNKNWLSGIKKWKNYLVKIPSGVKKGDYLLKFKLVKKLRNMIGIFKLALKQAVWILKTTLK